MVHRMLACACFWNGQIIVRTRWSWLLFSSKSKSGPRSKLVWIALKWSFRIVFAIFVVALTFSLVYGLYFVWHPEQLTETSGRTIATSFIIVFAALFYTALCDAWFRISNKDKQRMRLAYSHAVKNLQLKAVG